MKYVFYFFILILGFNAYAGASFSSASVSPNPVNAGENFTLEVVMNGKGSHWQSTRYTINGQSTCISESGLSAKTRTYALTAPSTADVYEINVEVFDRNSTCTSSGSSGSVNVTVQSSTSSSHVCSVVWPSEFTENFNGDFQLLYDLDSATNVYQLENANQFDWAAGVYLADSFILRNAQLAFTGSDPVTIYANEVIIEQSILNQYLSSPLIIIAKKVTITGSQVNGALYILDSDSSITGSSIEGALTSPVDLDFTYDNNAGPDNNLYYDDYYFDNANFGNECSGSGSNIDDNITATYLDKFNTAQYNINDGVSNWTGDWIESGDDGSATGGSIQITNGLLHLEGSNNSIRRGFDLTNYGEARLDFYYEYNTSGSDDDVTIEVSVNGGSTWAEVFFFDGGSDGTDTQSIDISAFAGKEAIIRVTTESGFDDNDDFDIEYIGITASGTPTAEHTFFDQFNNIAYDNNDGQLDFSTSWTEVGDDGQPDSGFIQVFNNQLYIGGADTYIYREVNLSPYASATLTFDYTATVTSFFSALYIQIREDSGAWVTLDVLSYFSDSSGTKTIDLSNHLSANTELRLVAGSYNSASSYFYIDNFAIDVELTALVCPVTPSYKEIYSDDFSSDSGNWFVNDFDRSVSVWPGQSIVNDSDEDQDVDYTITSGRLYIEGDSDLEDNEYGAVLHDLAVNLYQPDSITAYTIEVIAYPGESSEFNNDTGIIFGYQNDNNYYVVKWTKFGTVFDGDTIYPGEYRNFDLIKVEDGVATTLSSVQDLAPVDPTTIKVTVNDDGIQICLGGAGTLIASGEQPPIHKYGFFSYENEDGVSFDNLVVKCEDCEQVLTCPDTTSYDLIFSDDFDASSNNNWQDVTFDRTQVSIWPGDSIYSNNEEQSVMFSAVNGVMNIAGSVSSSADNEFGVVLHDVVNEGYDKTLITSYSINTFLTANATETNNNDVGLVFGYQDEQNFYLLNWSKIAQNYASDTTFPGKYRNLEIIKVENGVPARLAEEENFYAEDDISIKITVNGDGITICINNSNYIILPNYQPALGQVGFFSYDNDYGVQFDDFQVWCNGCSPSSTVDHYRIIHPTSGLTCSNYDVTVVACEDASCSSFSSDTVTGTLRKTNGTTTTNLLSANFDSGSQSVTFGHDVAETISFEFVNEDPAPDNLNVCVQGSATGAVTQCEMAFSSAGYEFSVNDFESASGWQQVDIQALKDDGSETCAPAYQGSQPVDISFDYNSVIVDSELLDISLTGSGNADTSISNTDTFSTNLTFSSGDATASFYINYADAGQLTLTVADGANPSVISSDSDNFLVYPSKLEVQMNAHGSPWLVSGANLHYASEPFNLIIRAVNALDDITQNYIPGDLKIWASMLSPSITDGANATTFNYSSSGAIGVTNDAGNWQSVNISNSFGEFGYETADAKFNDVGTFSFDVFDDNYYGRDVLGYGYDSASTSYSAAITPTARFIPYYFDISTDTQGQLQPTHGNAAYIGETLDYGTNPVLQFIARKFDGNTALNYQSFTPTFAARSYIEQGAGTNFDGGNLTSGSITVTEGTDYDGDFLVTLSGDVFTYNKTAALVSPFTSDLDLILNTADLTDSDGVGYCSGTNPSKCPTTYEPYTMPLAENVELRYGRLRLQNASGPEDENLPVPAFVEYWDGDTWVVNVEDSITIFGDLTGEVTFTDGSSSTFDFEINEVIDNHFVSGAIPAGDGFVVNHQNTAAELILNIDLDDRLNWLKIDWDGDGTLDDVVSSSVIFGRFKGNDRIIYKRER